MGQGNDIGAARGSIRISTEQLNEARAVVKSFSSDFERAFAGVSAATAKVEANLASARAATQNFAATATANARNSSAGLRAQLAAAANESNTAYLKSLTPEAKKVTEAFGSVTSQAKQMAAALGFSLGVAGVVQLSRWAVAASQMATAYTRQRVAAVSLAGSQAKLNDLLDSYTSVTGGAVAKSQAMADVTKLQAIGYADTASELENFLTAARGISIAMGSQQDYVIGQLQLAIANQSTMRLDQLGLGVTEVTDRIDQLRAANKELSMEMAYQNAIIGLATEKYGALAKSAAAQASGVEQLSKAWADFTLAQGQSSGGAINQISGRLAKDLQYSADYLEAMDAATKSGNFTAGKNANDAQKAGIARAKAEKSQADFFDSVTSFFQRLSYNMGTSGQTAAQFRAGQYLKYASDRPYTDDSQTGLKPPAPKKDRFDAETIQLIRDWSTGVKEIERNANTQRLAAVAQYEESRTSLIRSYNKTLSREAEDFAISRARQDAAYDKSIADMRRDAGRREAKTVEELGRTVATAEGDAAEQLAEARIDHGKRLAEIEKSFTKDRERAALDHRDRLMDAAGRLDAIAVREEQRNYARQKADAADAHKEQIDKENESYQERIDANAKALAKLIANANDAAQRQLDEARAADEERLSEMVAAYTEQKIQQDEDRARNLQRMAEDHQDQLDELDRQQALRLTQIEDQETEARAKFDAEFEKSLAAKKIQTDAHIAEDKRLTTEAITEFDRWFTNLELATAKFPVLGLGALTPGNVGHPSNADPYVDRKSPAVASRSITLAPGSVVVYGAVGQDEERIGQIVLEKMADWLEENK